VPVREAILKDARGIAEVHVASWRWAYRELLPDHVLDQLSIDDREAIWRRSLASPEPRRGCLVEEDGGRIVGFAAFGPPEDEGEPAGTGALYAIYLTEAAAGRGIGRKLLERATEAMRAAGFRAAVLWVFEANERARRFYERAGWTLDGGRSTYRIDEGSEPIVRYRLELR
jgi:ribosomal protein S18 acetylase RimI-like enzyme